MSATEFLVKAKDSVKPVHIDCILFFVATFTNCIAMDFAADSTFNYCNPHAVFWIRTIAPALSTSCTALLAFRNKTYAKWMADKNP